MEVEKVKELMGDYEREQMKSDLAIQAAVELIADSAVEVEAAAEEEKAAEEA
jgi:trigger factor